MKPTLRLQVGQFGYVEVTGKMALTLFKISHLCDRRSAAGRLVLKLEEVGEIRLRAGGRAAVARVVARRALPCQTGLRRRKSRGRHGTEGRGSSLSLARA